jgi:hypothetical protein
VLPSGTGFVTVTATPSTVTEAVRALVPVQAVVKPLHAVEIVLLEGWVPPIVW